MPPKRVLVQWLPSPALREERFLTHGSNYTSEVQQTGIELHDLEFPAAMALAQGRSHGFPQLQVGFACATRFTGEGWVLDGPLPTPHTLFDKEPSKAELIAVALDCAGGLTPKLEVRIERLREVSASVRERHAELTTKQAQLLLERTQAADAAVDASLTVPLQSGALSVDSDALPDHGSLGSPGDICYDTTLSPHWQWRRTSDAPWVDTGVEVVPDAAPPVSAILRAVSDRIL